VSLDHSFGHSFDSLQFDDPETRYPLSGTNSWFLSLIMRVLFVDSFEETAQALSDLVDTLGHTGMAARNSVEAVRAVAKLKPDAIFIDLLLGYEDGRDLCRLLRNDASLSECMFVAMTGLRQGDGQCVPVPFDELIVKPISVHVLQALLDRWTARRFQL
jgi:CheY-like chemotaxis protein